MAQVQQVTLYALILFSALMVFIGVSAFKKTTTLEGYLLGGRRIGPWVSAFAYGTAYFSAVIFIGYAGQIGWKAGFASMWIGIGNALLGSLAAWLILAKRTRRMTQVLGSKTMPEFFQERFDSVHMKVYSAAIIFIFLVPYSAAVYKGLGSLFVTIFPTANINVCLAIVAILTAIYVAFGGYFATVYTNFFQGIIMIVGVVIMVIYIVANPAVSGIANGMAEVNRLGILAGNNDLTSFFGGSNFKFLAFNIMLTSFGTWGMPQMITKYYSIKDEKSITQGAVISTAFALIIGVGAYFIGSLGRIFVPVENGLPQGGYDMVVPKILVQTLGLDGKILSTVVLAIFMLLLLSASMSTLASIVLTSSSAVSVDLIPSVYDKFKEKYMIFAMRIFSIIFVGLSFLFATTKITFIVNLMSFSWGVVSGCFIGPLIWGLYYKKTTKTGAWAGLISGVTVVGILTAVHTLTSNSFAFAMSMSPESGVAAMAVSMVVVPVVSLFTKDVPVENTKKAFAVMEVQEG
ncbi:MAG: hypothetical protein GX800_10845 [Clostridiaceae bacterium]|nr:hypothetical protein [Clostridiaceae bacterium]